MSIYQAIAIVMLPLVLFGTFWKRREIGRFTLFVFLMPAIGGWFGMALFQDFQTVSILRAAIVFTIIVFLPTVIRGRKNKKTNSE